MNIGEKFYCSRCLEEVEDDRICPYCGYNPEGETDRDAFEEGTLLGVGRYLIGSVTHKTDDFIFYGGYDLEGDRRIFLQEYFPAKLVERDAFQEDEIRIKKGEREIFLKLLKGFWKSCPEEGEVFQENGTVYLIKEFSRKFSDSITGTNMTEG